ncbi:NAD(P)H oxidoreductase YRKL / Flavodoxin 2 [Rhodovastum atsumiense]|uniref:NAD(P)H-dependent oxidoreductase n=1 Tax=Rhodovastum atsumiense TaxID=504468 RepID=A0A5M6ILY7_9PROT|nr:NAD(P)H-dependent oxidoreductase [Rhodovastum atsumiense]KAA5609286.1 NAD(P)H-dependent oxidoreductase [Rhodovastum atsumiense]CAH2604585.1 NAD(P)H oxidoreductase YRKL / Flavodoxin 2 [Rhodovastum atsumiense]
MHALVVTAHPDAASFTHAVARQVIAGIEAHPGHTTEMADLAAEGFDPRFTVADIALFNRRGAADAGVLAEQRRIDRADLLVLVYPIYWWSMPGLLKGWIDRVFTQGWAYDDQPEGTTVKRLGRLAVQLVGIGGADQGTFARHGYADAMRTQIDHGIFGYCGAPVVGSDVLLHADAPSREKVLHQAFNIGSRLAAAAPHGRTAPTGYGPEERRAPV